MSMNDRIKELRTEVQTISNQIKAHYAEMEAKGQDTVTPEDVAKFDNMLEDGKRKRAELERLEAAQDMDEYVNAPVQAKAQERPAYERALAIGEARKAWSQKVFGSEQYKRATAISGNRTMDPVEVGKLPIQSKALHTTISAAGGALIVADRQPDMIMAPQRPLRVLDLVNQAATNSNTVEYAEYVTRTNAAAPVAEYTAGNFGLKPESNLDFVLRSAPVKTIATWVAASRNVLADAPQLQGIIDQELPYMVEVTLEDQVLKGDGTGQNFTGMLNWSGIQTRTMHATTPIGRGQTTSDTRATTIRRAITDIALEFYEANGIIMHPSDAENVEITEYNGNRYANAFDPVTFRIWRVPVVLTPAMTDLTALVGNFQLAATLWDREQTEVRVGEPNDFFLRNAVAVLAELRAAFAVRRPKALERITLI